MQPFMSRDDYVDGRETVAVINGWVGVTNVRIPCLVQVDKGRESLPFIQCNGLFSNLHILVRIRFCE